MIALACIYIALTFKDKETTAWFEELRVDMNVVSLAILEHSSECLIFLHESGYFLNLKLFYLRGDLQIKNISMEILDFYDYFALVGGDPQKGIPEERINPALAKLLTKA